MAKTPDGEQTKPRIADKVSAFLHRFRKQIIIIVAVLFVGGIGAVVVMELQSRRAEEALVRIEAVQEQYDEWSAADEDRRAELEPELFAEIEAIRDGFTGTYGALRAAYIEANMQFELERYSEALTAFERVADQYEETHLAPRALLYAAFAAEELEELGRAEQLFRRIAERYGKDAPETPRALFGLARIYEAGERFGEAADAYDELVEEYSASPWSNMARNRLILLRAEERI